MQARKGGDQAVQPPNPATLAVYEHLHGVPDCIIERAVCADNDEHANQLAAAYLGDREGYANSRPSPEDNDGIQSDMDEGSAGASNLSFLLLT